MFIRIVLCPKTIERPENYLKVSYSIFMPTNQLLRRKRGIKNHNKGISANNKIAFSKSELVCRGMVCLAQ